MNPGIHIHDGVIEFLEFPRQEIGVVRYCASFNLKLDEVKMIAISPRLVLDDEALFILVVNRNGEIFPMPDMVLGSAGLRDFEGYFELRPILDEWDKFHYNDHYGKYDKLIFPGDIYWTDLFKHDWKWILRRLLGSVNPTWFYGNMRK